MENENISQLELFSEKNANSPEKIRKKPVSFFGYFRRYEKIILIIIGFIITGVVSFCLGVKKGKDIAISNTASRLDIAVLPKQQQKPQAATMQAQVITTSTSIITPSVNVNNIKSYTVQVASFQTKALAQKEVELLRKKGFSALSLTKGRYIIVCVGNFNNQETAKSSLSQLKKNYPDCLIRRL